MEPVKVPTLGLGSGLRKLDANSVDIDGIKRKVKVEFLDKLEGLGFLYRVQNVVGGGEYVQKIDIEEKMGESHSFEKPVSRIFIKRAGDLEINIHTEHEELQGLVRSSLNVELFASLRGFSTEKELNSPISPRVLKRFRMVRRNSFGPDQMKRPDLAKITKARSLVRTRARSNSLLVTASLRDKFLGMGRPKVMSKDDSDAMEDG